MSRRIRLCSSRSTSAMLTSSSASFVLCVGSIATGLLGPAALPSPPCTDLPLPSRKESPRWSLV
eukprot:scaffold394838_cov39-Prasinocladus_malaysianus.AAC.1